MSKQHHFVVFYDTETEEWEIGWATFEEDVPLYDTEEEEWHHLRGEDHIRDSRFYEDLRKRLAKES